MNFLKSNNKIDSLKKRYFSKIISSIVILPISIITQSLVARGLGSANYGDFNFLTNFFNQVVTFLDGGTSTGLYTKLSRRLEETNLLKIYWYYILVVCLLVITPLPFIFYFHKQGLIWPNQLVLFINLAALFSLMQWGTQIINKVVDAYGITKQGEIIRVAQRLLGFVLILILFFSKNLNLLSFFLYQYFIIILLCLGWWYILRSNDVLLFSKTRLSINVVKSYLKEFWTYSHPLLIQSIIILLSGLFSLWLLQKYSGSVEQGYYMLSYKISSIPFLFVSAMTPLFIREFSIAFGKRDFIRMRFLQYRYIIPFFFIVSFLSLFISINADSVVFFMGGKQFYMAKSAVMIMALYPIHQTYGQLISGIFLATDQTKLFSIITIIMALINFPVAWLLLAPGDFYGFDLKSTGMALDMVLLQFISVNILLWFSSKYLHLSFSKFFNKQIFTILLFLIIAFVTKFLAQILSENKIISIFINFLFYSFLTGLIIYIKPSLISSSKNELILKINYIKLKLIEFKNLFF